MTGPRSSVSSRTAAERELAEQERRERASAEWREARLAELPPWTAERADAIIRVLRG